MMWAGCSYLVPGPFRVWAVGSLTCGMVVFMTTLSRSVQVCLLYAHVVDLYPNVGKLQFLRIVLKVLLLAICREQASACEALQIAQDGAPKRNYDSQPLLRKKCMTA